MNDIPQEVFIIILNFYGFKNIKFNILTISKSIYNSIKYFIELTIKNNYEIICKILKNKNICNYVQDKYEGCIMCDNGMYDCAYSKCTICQTNKYSCTDNPEKCYLCNDRICKDCVEISKCIKCKNCVCWYCTTRLYIEDDWICEKCNK